MTSSLTAQLQKLQTPLGEGLTADFRKRKSLIYDSKELNCIDYSTHLERAQRAFAHICNLDPELNEFTDYLFSEATLQFEPTMQTPTEKAALNDVMNVFLLRMSPHLLWGLSLEVLEWLVQKFQVHLYHQDALISSVFPYHSCNLFPKFIQLLDFNSDNKKWHWLRPIASQGISLVKSELVRRASKDHSILLFLSNLVPQAIKVFGIVDSRLQLFVNLYTQVCVGVLSKRVSPKFMTVLVNSLNFYILKGFKSSSALYKSSSLQIVMLLAGKNKLHVDVLRLWIKKLFKYAKKSLTKESVIVISILCKMQMFTLPEDNTNLFYHLCSETGVLVLNQEAEMVMRDTSKLDIYVQPSVSDDVEMADVDDKQVSTFELLKMREKIQAQRLGETVHSLKTVCFENEDHLRLSDALPSLILLLCSDCFKTRSTVIERIQQLFIKYANISCNSVEIEACLKLLVNESQGIIRDSSYVLRPAIAAICTPLLWSNLCRILSKSKPENLEFNRLIIKKTMCFFDEKSFDLCLKLDRDAHTVLASMLQFPCLDVVKNVASHLNPKLISVLTTKQQVVLLKSVTSSFSLHTELLTTVAGYQFNKDTFISFFLQVFAFAPKGSTIKELTTKRRVSIDPVNMYSNFESRDHLQLSNVLRILKEDVHETLTGAYDLVELLLTILKTVVSSSGNDKSTDENDDEGVNVHDHTLEHCSLVLNAILELLKRHPQCLDKGPIPAVELLDMEPLFMYLQMALDYQSQNQVTDIFAQVADLSPLPLAESAPRLLSFLTNSRFFSRSDSFASSILDRIMTSIVPAFIACKSRVRFPGLKLLNIFLNAYDEIPPSKRIDIYYRLVEKAGTSDYLWRLLLLLNDRVLPAPSRKRKRAGSESEFAGAVKGTDCCYDILGSMLLVNYSPAVQFESCCSMLVFVSSLKNEDDELSTTCKKAKLSAEASEKDLEDNAVLFAALSCQNTGLIMRGVLSLITYHLGRHDLISKVNGLLEPGDCKSMSKLLEFLISTLVYNIGIGTRNRQLAVVAIKACEKAEAFVPGNQFLDVIDHLLDSNDSSVHKKAFDLMYSKLSGVHPPCSPAMITGMIRCVDRVKQYSNVQTALICGKELARLLCGQQQALFRNLGLCIIDKVVLTKTVSDASGWELEACGLLLLAECVKQSGVAMIQLVAGSFPQLLKKLRRHLTSSGCDLPYLHIQSCFVFFQQCAAHLPDLLSPYLLDFFPVIFNSTKLPIQILELDTKIKFIIHKLGQHVDFSLLLPSLLTYVNSLQIKDYWQFGFVASLLKIGVKSIANDSTVTEFADDLQKLIITLLSFRERSVDIFDMEEIRQTEDAVIFAVGPALFSLPENYRINLMQFFLEFTSDASIDAHKYLSRKIVLYRMLECLVMKNAVWVSDIFVKFEMFDQVISILNKHNCSLESYLYQNLQDENNLLLCSVLSVLQKIFQAETSVLTIDLQESLTFPLIKLLEHFDDSYESRVKDFLNPCLLDFAKTMMGDETVLRPLLKEICAVLQTTSELACRLWVLQLLGSLLVSLDEAFINSLGNECVQTLAECIESDDAGVERLAQQLLKDIEAKVGEPLDV